MAIWRIGIKRPCEPLIFDVPQEEGASQPVRVRKHQHHKRPRKPGKSHVQQGVNRQGVVLSSFPIGKRFGRQFDDGISPMGGDHDMVEAEFEPDQGRFGIWDSQVDIGYYIPFFFYSFFLLLPRTFGARSFAHPCPI